MCSLTFGEMFPHTGAMSLLEMTQLLLDETLAAGINPRQIAEESEGAVNYEWLKKFTAGKIPDPGVSRVQALHDALTAIKSKRALPSIGAEQRASA